MQAKIQAKIIQATLERKENCTITQDGKTYKLYGKVKIVEHFEGVKK